MKRSRTLLRHLMVFVLVLTVPILVVAFIVTYSFANAERSRLEASADNANQEIVTLVEREISSRLAMLQALATAPSLQTGDIAAFEAQAREFSRRTGVLTALFDPAGMQLMSTHHAPGAPLHPTGDPDLVEEVMRSRQAYVSNLFRSWELQHLRTQVAVPVMRGGEVAAILSSTMMPERLAQLLREGLPPGPFYATILDRKGIIIARSTGHERMAGKPLPMLAERSQGLRGSVSMASADGIPVFAYYRRPAASGWVIAAAVEQAALTTPLTDSLRMFAASALGLAGVAVLGAWWIGRRLTHAHKELVGAAVAIGEGRTVSPPVTQIHEVNLVGQILAAASRSIASHAEETRLVQRQLEVRVEERTRELSAKRALLETTIDTMNQGLIVFDERGRIPVCNARARNMLDLPWPLMDRQPGVEEVIALLELRGIPLHSADGASHLLRPAAGCAPVFEVEWPDGTVLEVQAMPVRDGLGFVQTFSSVTEQRRHARELEEAKDAAVRASRAKDEFLATMSHEMRTPLNAVIGYSERFLRDQALSLQARRMAEHILSAGSALLCLVNDVLDIGRIEAGIIDVRHESFLVTALVEEAISLVQPLSTDKGLALDVVLGEGLGGFFRGDRDRLRQVLLNLLNNAIKFTAAGGVRLRVARRDTPRGDRIRFSVIDTGIGIAKSDQGKLFQGFFQVDPTISRRFGGVGLGLVISRRLVERMGGAIGVESAPGEGSTFWFEVTLTPVPPGEAAGKDPPAVPRPARILVAEDLAINQELARELLESDGHRVEVVSNGVEAVEAARGGPYDLVLMDVSMPEMDGLAAARLIRSADPARALPIVACTANVFTARLAEFREAGVDAYLRKPLRQSELRETIQRVLTIRPEARCRPEEGHGQPKAPDAECLDAGCFDAPGIVSLLGAKRVIAALDGLMAQLRTLAALEPARSGGHQGLADRAHTLISTASILGMVGLAQGSRDLEIACHEGGAVEAALERLMQVAEPALVELEQIRARIEAQDEAAA
ncbi:ATP-binding protein [Muricoccus vinaceus]|uniref:histidine kinase n=1 Tax=Muricoccus vinaceus TaxID=424704 RepID=A0ABV6IUS6_9PROT